LTTKKLRVHCAVPELRSGDQTQQRFGGHGERETPGSIPNPEAKPFSADGTAWETAWESRTPPDIFVKRGHLRVAPLDACPGPCSHPRGEPCRRLNAIVPGGQPPPAGVPAPVTLRRPRHLPTEAHLLEGRPHEAGERAEPTAETAKARRRVPMPRRMLATHRVGAEVPHRSPRRLGGQPPIGRRRRRHAVRQSPGAVRQSPGAVRQSPGAVRQSPGAVPSAAAQQAIGPATPTLGRTTDGHRAPGCGGTQRARVSRGARVRLMRGLDRPVHRDQARLQVPSTAHARGLPKSAAVLPARQARAGRTAGSGAPTTASGGPPDQHPKDATSGRRRAPSTAARGRGRGGSTLRRLRPCRMT